MTEPQLVMIDGRDALMAVLVQPSADDPDYVHVSTHCHGLDKLQAAELLESVAQRWRAEAAQ